MAAVQNIPMLSCSDIYFINDDGKYRLQWSTNALVEGISKPVLDDDDYDEYYRQLAKYNYIKKHKDDSSNTAAKFLCRVYDYQTGNLIDSIQTDGFCAEFDLESGEYLWDVQALDDKGNVITSSGKNYICTFPCNNNSSGVSAKDSSQYHTISHTGDCYGNSFRLAVAIEINSHDGNTANFIVCGPSQNGPHMDWEAAIEGGFDFSDSNAFDGFTGNFCMGKDTMISSRGIYEYENGQWNYKTFTEIQYYASEAGFSNDFLFTDGGANGKTIYQWNSETDRLVSIQTAPGDVYGLSANYYICADGVFSINSGKKIINRKIFYGENLIYDDMYLNVVAQNNGKDCDTISEGQRGKIIARYFRFDSENNKVLEPYEVVLFDGKAENCEVESEEIFSCRIGNIFCYVFESDEGNTAKIHIWEEGKVREVSTSFYGEDYSFYADNQNRLVLNCEGNAMVITDAGTVTYLPGVPEDISIVEDDRNNWLDLAANGSASKEIGKAENLSDISGWVGDGDKVDHWEFNLENAAKLKFNLSATDAAKFTISQLAGKSDRYGNITYSLKSLQSAAVKAGSNVSTKNLLLDKGTYYITMASTNAAKGGSADYKITLDNENSLFYDRADDGFDNWLYDKKSNKLNDGVSFTAFAADQSGWVGFGDAADYYRISSEFPAKISFDLTATDAAKFTVWSVTTGEDKKGNTTYKVKSLQSTTLKLDKATGKYSAGTKALLLNNSDENVSYYYSMESTNAAKGGSADYQITLDNENSLFYDRADNGFDNWLYDKKSNELNYGMSFTTLDENHSGWVGFGDSADFYQISPDIPAMVSFDLTATDAAKFTVWSVTTGEDKKGNVTYKVKSLQSTALKLDKASGKYSAGTKALLLNNSGENIRYYYSMESTNAAKGGSADYQISLDSSNSVFYDRADNGFDNWLYDKKNKELNDATGYAAIGDHHENWVGFGDAADYYQLSLHCPVKVSFELTATDAAKFTVWSVTTGEDRNGNVTYKVKSLQSTALKLNKTTGQYFAVTKDLLLDNSDENISYYYSMESTNAAKGGNAEYSISSGNCIWFDYGDTADDEYENAGDIGTIYGDSDISFVEDWVGFGDVIDYHSFRVENDMELFFNISSTDAVKFSVCQLVNGSLKELRGGTAVKADSSASTKAFSFKSGNTYYIAVKSTNAAKGGNAHYAVSGEKYVKPLIITLDGEEWYGGAEDNLPDDEARYQNGPECSGQADKITFAGDRLHLITDIDMKGGNDLITIQKSADEGMVGVRGELTMGNGDDKIMINSESELFVGGSIDFGDGNDILQLAGDNDVTASEIHFGDGNDLLDVKNESDICASIHFGNGNNTMKVGSSSIIKSEQDGFLSFGEGRNTLQIDKGGEVFFNEIYFGMDSNTLILNGTLGISYADFSTVDKITGSGQLLINAWQTDVESLQCFADTDIDIIAMFDMASALYFSDRRTELSDNTLDKAVNMRNDDEYEANFWICDQLNAGQNIYGLADEVDYMKFVKNDDCDMLAIESTGYNFTIDLLDAAGNILKSADPYIGTDVDISDLDNGKTYYVRVMTGESGYGAGKICLYDN